LSSQEVCEDQRKMREKILQEKREKEKESQTLESSKSEDKKRETQERKKLSETHEVRENFLATKTEVKGLFHSKQPLYLLICKNYVLTTASPLGDTTCFCGCEIYRQVHRSSSK